MSRLRRPSASKEHREIRIELQESCRTLLFTAERFYQKLSRSRKLSRVKHFSAKTWKSIKFFIEKFPPKNLIESRFDSLRAPKVTIGNEERESVIKFETF